MQLAQHVHHAAPHPNRGQWVESGGPDLEHHGGAGRLHALPLAADPALAGHDRCGAAQLGRLPGQGSHRGRDVLPLHRQALVVWDCLPPAGAGPHDLFASLRRPPTSSGVPWPYSRRQRGASTSQTPPSSCRTRWTGWRARRGTARAPSICGGHLQGPGRDGGRAQRCGGSTAHHALNGV